MQKLLLKMYGRFQQMNAQAKLSKVARSLGLPDLCMNTLAMYQSCARCKKKYGYDFIPILLCCNHLICETCFKAADQRSQQNLNVFFKMQYGSQMNQRCPFYNTKKVQCNKTMREKVHRFKKIIDCQKQLESFLHWNQQKQKKFNEKQSIQTDYASINSNYMSIKTNQTQNLHEKRQGQLMSQYKFVVKNIEGQRKVVTNIQVQNQTFQSIIIKHAKQMIRPQQANSVQQIYLMYDDSTNTLPYQTIKRQKIKSIVKLTKEKTNEITICKRYSGDIIILFNHI